MKNTNKILIIIIFFFRNVYRVRTFFFYSARTPISFNVFLARIIKLLPLVNWQNINFKKKKKKTEEKSISFENIVALTDLLLLACELRCFLTTIAFKLLMIYLPHKRYNYYCIFGLIILCRTFFSTLGAAYEKLSFVFRFVFVFFFANDFRVNFLLSTLIVSRNFCRKRKAF